MRMIQISCSRCGKRSMMVKKSTSMAWRLANMGWGSYGSALYCPNCTKTWYDRNTKPMADEDNTFENIVDRMLEDAEMEIDMLRGKEAEY